MRASRSGFTLVELMVALILFVIVGGAMYRLLNVSQRVSRTQTEKANMQGGLRTGVQLAVAELQELWADDVSGASAIVSMTDTELHYNAMRGIGVSCVTPTTTQLVIRRATYNGLITPTGADYDAYLFVENNEDIEGDDAWLAVNVTGVANGVCTDGAAGIQLSLTGVASVAGVQAIAPVRIYELMELGQVTADGRNWLGIGREGIGEDLQPLAGPLETNGLDFDYRDDFNAPTTNVNNVKTIVLRLFGESERSGNTRGVSSQTALIRDTVTVRVHLRNAR